jgi:hypothetical protein
MEQYAVWKAWLLIIGGVATVGVGGLLSTLGWNMRSQHQQKRNIIRGVIREFESNGRMIDSAINLIKQRKTSFSYRPYKANQLNNALTSGVLNFDTDKRRALRDVMERYEEAIADFNAGLGVVGRLNPGMYIRPEFIPQPGKINPNDFNNALSEKFDKLLLAHQRTGQILEKEYNWALVKR